MIPSSSSAPRRSASRLAAVIAAGAIVATGLAACGTDSDARSGSGSGGTTKITVASQPNGAGLPLYIAEKEGYFADEKLDVTITNYASGPESLAAGAAGDWQAGWLGAPPALTGANTFQLIPAGVMIREDANHIMFMRRSVLKGSTPAKVLASHPVATSQGSLAEQVMRACADKLGVDGAKTKIVPLDGGGVVQALQSDKVDVANSWASPDWPLLSDPAYEQVCSGKDAGVAVLDPFVITPKFAKSDPDAAAAYLRAVYRADDYINAHHDEAVDDLVAYYKKYGIEGTRKMADYEVSIRTWYSLDDAISGIESGETATGLKASAEFFVKTGVYTSVPPVDDLLKQGLTLLKAAKKGQD